MAATETQLEPWEEIALIVQDAVDSAGGEFHSSQLAGQILDRIRQERTDLWEAWVATLALDQLKLVIGRSRQARRRATSPLRRKGFSLTEEVDSSHTIRQWGDMVRSDVDYIYRAYTKRAKTNTLRAQRVKAILAKMPNDQTTRVRDVISEQDVEAIYG